MTQSAIATVLLFSVVRKYCRFTPEAELVEWLTPAFKRLDSFSNAIVAKHIWELKKLETVTDQQELHLRTLSWRLKLLGVTMLKPVQMGTVWRDGELYIRAHAVTSFFLHENAVLYYYKVTAVKGQQFWFATHINWPEHERVKYSRLPKKVRSLMEQAAERLYKTNS